MRIRFEKLIDMFEVVSSDILFLTMDFAGLISPLSLTHQTLKARFEILFRQRRIE